MTAPRFTYLRDPAAIYAESFATIRREADLSGVPASLHAVVIRLVHAVGDLSILADLVWSANAGEAGRMALRQGAPILVDAEMVAHGITKSRLPAQNNVICRLRQTDVPELALQSGMTRSAAAVTLWRPNLGGAVVAIGNAPTALFQLLEMIEDGAPQPAIILGFPVGFVGAADSKAALVASEFGIPFITLRGRRGGSALAAAAVNALAGSADEGLMDP